MKFEDHFHKVVVEFTCVHYYKDQWRQQALTLRDEGTPAETFHRIVHLKTPINIRSCMVQ